MINKKIGMSLEDVFDFDKLKFYTVEEKLGIRLYHGSRLAQISDYALEQISHKSLEELQIGVEDKDSRILAVFKTGEEAVEFQEKHKEYVLWLNMDWAMLYEDG